MNGNDNLGDYSYLRDLITDIMHYVTEKNLGPGPEDMLVGASEVYKKNRSLKIDVLHHTIASLEAPTSVSTPIHTTSKESL